MAQDQTVAIVTPTDVVGRVLAELLPDHDYTIALEAEGLPPGAAVVIWDEAAGPLPADAPPAVLLAGAEETAVAADVVLVKPVALPALLAAVAGLLRRGGAAAGEPVLAIGPYRLHPDSRVLTGPEGEERLTDKEAAILALLHAAAPRAVRREALLEDIWGYNAGIDTHTLETHVYRLRRKLETDEGAPEHLLTEEGGYRLVT